MVRSSVALSLSILSFVAAAVSAASPTPDPRLKDRWRADIQLRPGAALPFFGRFASADVSIYPHGVAAESTFLRAWIRNGANAVRVEHSLARLYSDVPVASIRPTLLSLARTNGAVIQGLPVTVAPPQAGKVRGLTAQKYRMQFTDEGFLDVWTTTVIPPNPQFRRVQHEFLSAIWPEAAAAAAKLPGTPVYVELNTPKHKKVVLLRLDKVVIDVPPVEQEKALSTGALFAKAPFSERFWR